MSKKDERDESAAEMQVSAGQILAEAYERRDPPVKYSNYGINDLEELNDYQLKIRTSYEKALQFKRSDIDQYVRYAKWEWDLKNYDRARSILERAININNSNVRLWLAYLNLEISHKNINHARNLFERCLTILPKVDKFYYEYIQFEEILGNFNNVKEIFNRWINWKPKNSKIYLNYIRFLNKYKDLENCRKIYEKLIIQIPQFEYIEKYIIFEKKNGGNVANLYNLIIENLQKSNILSQEILISYIDYELSLSLDSTNLQKIDKIFKFGFDNLSKDKSIKLYNYYINYLKQYNNDKFKIESGVLLKRKLKYESELIQTPNDYDLWWIYLDLILELSLPDVESYFEKCLLENIPKFKKEKKYWKRYLLLWLRYLYYLELDSKKIEKTREMYDKLLKEIIPNKYFTSGKIWMNYSNFEIRQGNLIKARKLYGYCMGKFPNKKFFYKKYIDLELNLKQFDNVRKIYEKFLIIHNDDLTIWFNYINFEIELEEYLRAEKLIEILLLNPSTMSEKFKIYKFYLNFLIHDLYDFKRTRKVYQNLLQESDYNVNIYIAYALNELSIPTDEQLQKFQENADDEGMEIEITDVHLNNVRNLFEKGSLHYKQDKEKRITLLEAYKNFEKSYGDQNSYDKVKSRLPLVVKRKTVNEEGEQKEVIDYIFEDDNENKKDNNDKNGDAGIINNEFLANARKWMLENSKK
ncbi:hypothetical protein PACTADRAFT_1486 [Pachysolen tannophilus NRRL Y-2460]|uniref:Pre-mRNA-splicing factor CLF1 n=1 Tax=Pachysolen tannophilus NRRL Y-2460 TaxID=669874 RepID=A0A1E4TYU1_PACTA|nr:hypothetical protein PACTADRAFT_1486 [Pachysolen tannophilus NRRL Y-2460]